MAAFRRGRTHNLPGIRPAAWSAGLAPIVLAALLAPAASVPAEEIDRLLVAVNGAVVTEGDLHVARSLNALVSPGGAAASREQEISRMIDLELIRQELENLRIEPEVAPEIQARIRELGDRYAGDGGLAARLARLGITEAELDAFLRTEVLILRFLEFRFRPFVRVQAGEIEAYYRGRLAPQLEGAAVPVPPLEEVSAPIEAVLVEEKINAELERWIADARRNGRIDYFDNDGPPPSAE